MGEQIKKKSQKDGEKLPKGAKRVYHCRTHTVDFLKNQGGPLGVQLILDSDNVKKLRSALKTCSGIASRAGKDKVQIEAHWGHRKQDKGFRLDVRVYYPPLD